MIHDLPNGYGAGTTELHVLRDYTKTLYMPYLLLLCKTHAFIQDGMKNFISIGKFETDYDIYFGDKKVLVSRADFSDVKFMTPRDSDGSTGYVVEEKNDVVIDKTGVEEKKNDGVQDLEELTRRPKY